MKNFNDSEFITAVIGFILAIIVVGVIVFAPAHPERKPLVIKPPDARKTGEAIGKTTGRFSRGFFRGLWESGEKNENTRKQ